MKATNERLLDSLRHMSEEELFNAVYRDILTGALNRKAFMSSRSQVVAIVDIDGLKWVNDNKGHRGGDQFLKNFYVIVQMEFADRNIFRISGDEFAIRANSSLDLVKGLDQTRRRFKWFSYGFGRSLSEADGGMRYQKGRRAKDGERAERGEEPPGLGDAFMV